KTRDVDATQLMYDAEKKKVVSDGRWVYTGSTMLPSGYFLSDLDGVVIGFVHSPAPIIENVATDAVNRYGFIVFNASLGLKAGTPVTLTIRALSKPKK